MPDPGLADLRITEVLADPAGKDGGAESAEFVELFNPTASPVALEALILSAQSWPELDAADLGIADLSLEPGGVLVVSRWVNDLLPDPSGVQVIGTVIYADFTSGDGLRNANGAVSVGAQGLTGDAIAYGESVDPMPVGWLGVPVVKPSSGSSLCRLINQADSDTSEDWASCSPSPGQVDPVGSEDEGGNPSLNLDLPREDEEPISEPDAIAYGALAVVEVHADPLGPSEFEKSHEFIELINISNNSIELKDVLVSDGESPDDPGTDPLFYLSGEGGCESPTCLAPGHRALIVGQSYDGPSGVALVLSTDDSNIADGGLTKTEAVTIWDGQGGLITSYRLWVDPSADPIPMAEQPMHRLTPEVEDLPESWIEAPATPGE